MATIEERLEHIEHEHASLKRENDDFKQKLELHTLAIGGLVNKAMLERINEKNDKIFQALMAHDEFTNQQLSELREKVEVQIEGKIVGMQAEMRQRFEQQDGKIAGLQTGMRQRFDTIDARFDQQEIAINARFDQIMHLLTTLAPKPEQGA